MVERRIPNPFVGGSSPSTPAPVMGNMMEKDDATWLNIFYVANAFLAAFVFWKALEMLGIQMNLVERYTWYAIAQNVVAVALGVGTALFLRSNKERHEYMLSAIGELRKVSWPTMPDTRKMTVIVCWVVGIFALVLAGFDWVWGKILGLLLA